MLRKIMARTGCQGEYLDQRGRKWLNTEEICINSTPCHVLLEAQDCISEDNNLHYLDCIRDEMEGHAGEKTEPYT
jgi:hypothetical protein